MLITWKTTKLSLLILTVCKCKKESWITEILMRFLITTHGTTWPPTGFQLHLQSWSRTAQVAFPLLYLMIDPKVAPVSRMVISNWCSREPWMPMINLVKMTTLSKRISMETTLEFSLLTIFRFSTRQKLSLCRDKLSKNLTIAFNYSLLIAWIKLMVKRELIPLNLVKL